MLTKDRLLSFCFRRVEKIEVPMAGGHVFVRAMSTQERDEHELFSMKNDSNSGSRVMMILNTACDEKGELIFSADDIPMIEKMDIAVSQPIYAKAIDMAYFTEEDVEELEKNSGSDL